MISAPINKLAFSEEELAETAKKILGIDSSLRVFLFEGEMGSGKTTLIKEICRQLGSKDNLSSPSFSLVNEYTSPKGKLFHIDLYRVKNQAELFDLGIEQYLDSGNYCFIEWSAPAEPLIEGNYLKIYLQSKDKIRYLSAELH